MLEGRIEEIAFTALVIQVEAIDLEEPEPEIEDPRTASRARSRARSRAEIVEPVPEPETIPFDTIDSIDKRVGDGLRTSLLVLGIVGGLVGLLAIGVAASGQIAPSLN